MAWRLARSLEQLRREVNAHAPRRSKASDGTIGDPAHASRPSRHNPNNAGVVCGIDITHDPANGCDVHAFARRHVQHPHPNLDNVISNGEIASRKTGWKWVRYTGSNEHRKHAHFGVGVGPDSEPRPPYDDQTPWGFAPAPVPHPPEEVDVIGKDQLDDRKAAARQIIRLYKGRNPNNPDELNKVVMHLAQHGYEATVIRFADHNGNLG